MTEYFINQIFIEIRFGDAILFNDVSRIKKISDYLADKLPQRNYDENAKVLTMVNCEKNNRVILTKNRLVLDYNEPDNFEQFKDEELPIMKYILNELEIYSIGRIGMRSLRGINKSNMQEAIKYIEDNFMNNNIILNEEMSGCGVEYQFSDNDYLIGLKICPNQYNNIKIENGRVISNSTKYQVMVDSDISVSNGKTNEIIECFVDKVININNEKIDKFIDKVSEC